MAFGESRMPTNAVALASASLVFPDYALIVVTVLPLLSLLISCLKVGCSVSPAEKYSCTWSITCGVCQCLIPEAAEEPETESMSEPSKPRTTGHPQVTTL